MTARKTSLEGHAILGDADVDKFRKLHKFVEKIAIREKMLTAAQAASVKITITNRDGRTCASMLKQDYHLKDCFFGPTDKNMAPDWMYEARQARRPAVRSHMQCFMASHQLQAYSLLEYASFYNKPGISTFSSKDLNEVMLVLIAHEMSHTINQFNQFASVRSKWCGTNHDHGFQATYRFLRARALAEYRDWKAGALERKAAARKSGEPKRG